MAKKSSQELEAIRRAFGRPVLASPAGLRTSGLAMTLSPKQRKQFKAQLAAQARATS